jgi:peroxiredoxin
MKTTLFMLVAVLMTWPLAVLAQKEPVGKPKRPVDPPTQVLSPRKKPVIEGHVYINDPAQDFVLESAEGASVRLSKLKGDWLVLVFSDRVEPVSGLRQIDGDLKRLGARIVAVCHEKTSRLRSVAQSDSVDFLLLSDITGEIAQIYGLYDRDRSETQPGFIIIDRRGIVRSAVLGQELPPDQIVQIARAKITGV